VLVDAGPSIGRQIAESDDLLTIAIGALSDCVLAPIDEEVIFRAFLFGALSYYMPVGLAVGVQAVIFGAIVQLARPVREIVRLARPHHRACALDLHASIAH
jgi:membrane protease YdiL (CAAX protease family)